METVNISFDITSSTIPMRFNFSVTPLKNETPQQEVTVAAVPEEHKPASDYLRIAEPESHLPAEVPTYQHNGQDISDAGEMLPTSSY